MIPDRARYYPDINTVEINRLRRLTPEQEKLYKDSYDTFRIKEIIDTLIYSQKGTCYQFSKNKNVNVGDMIDGKMDGSLLPFVNYRFYYLENEDGEFSSLLSAELEDSTDENFIIQRISSGFKNSLGLTDNGTYAGNTETPSNPQKVRIRRALLKRNLPNLLLYFGLVWPFLITESSIAKSWWAAVQKDFMVFTTLIFICACLLLFLALEKKISFTTAIGLSGLSHLFIAQIVNIIPIKLSCFSSLIYVLGALLLFPIVIIAGHAFIFLFLVVVTPIFLGKIAYFLNSLTLTFLSWFALFIFMLNIARNILNGIVPDDIKTLKFTRPSDMKKLSGLEIIDYLGKSQILIPGLAYKITYSATANILLDIEVTGIAE
jgi:hypothetical protein